MKGIAYILAVSAIACTLAACAPGDLPLPGMSASDFNFPALTLGQDNYCEIAKRRSWHPGDTTETVNGIRAENRKWTCLCTEQRGTPACRKYQQTASVGL